jgi:hypothetical protein
MLIQVVIGIEVRQQLPQEGKTIWSFDDTVSTAEIIQC